MKLNWKKTAAALVVLASVAAPALAAEQAGRLADGELFVYDRSVKDGKVLYTAGEQHKDWEHDPEAKVPGLVCTAFVPAAEKLQGQQELRSIKKYTRAQEKAEAARRTYSGPDYKGRLALYAAMDTRGRNGNLAITRVERFGRLLNVTVAIKDPAAVQESGEAIYQDSVVFLPLKKLPTFGNLRVRFSDTTGHALEDLDVALPR